VLVASTGEALGHTFGQTVSETFNNAPHGVDQSRSDFDEFAPRSEHRQVPLLGQIAMPDRVKELWVETSETRQSFRILRVVLPSATGNDGNLPGIGNDHFMAETRKKLAHPGRLPTGFDSYSHAGHFLEMGRETLPTGSEAAFLKGLAVGTKNTIVAEFISEIDPNRLTIRR
jgi:hypothetical protein